MSSRARARDSEFLMHFVLRINHHVFIFFVHFLLTLTRRRMPFKIDIYERVEK